MKYQLLAAGVALAPLASAGSARRRQHGSWHNHDDVSYVTDVEVVTLLDVVTVIGNEPPAFTPAPVAVSPATASTPVESSTVGAVAGGPIVVPDSSPAAPTASTEAPSTSSAVQAPTSESSPAANNNVASSFASSHEASSTAAPKIQSTTLATKVASSAATASITAAKAKAQSSSSGSTGKNVTSSSLTPRGRKAGLSGYVGIQQLQAFTDLSPYISWYSDYTANTPSSGDVMGVGMLWAAFGSGCGGEVTNRVNAFDTLVAETTPEIMFGFYEPDCYCPDSSAMTTSQGQDAWNNKLAPLKNKGTVLGSPSMCKQTDETWLTPFMEKIDAHWDVTSVHINVVDLDGVKADIEYYASKYGKPIWVSEFACVDGHNTWTPCTDQDHIDQFISDAVNYFQNNDTVVAYGPSNGNGLGNTWPLTNVDGTLSASGKAYLNAIKNL